MTVTPMRMYIILKDLIEKHGYEKVENLINSTLKLLKEENKKSA